MSRVIRDGDGNASGNLGGDKNTNTNTTSGSTSTSTSTTTSNSNSGSGADDDSDHDSSTTTESSSEEFFDAEEPNTGTLIRFSRKILEGVPVRVDLTTLTKAEIDSGAGGSEDFCFVTPSPHRRDDDDGSVGGAGGDESENNESSLIENLSQTSILSKSEMEEVAEEEKRRRRLAEMRKRLNNDEIEEAPPDDQTSPSDSQTSSVEGLYGAICGGGGGGGRTSHPFKVVDHDSVSLQSGVSSGRAGRMGNPSLSLSPFSSSSTPPGSQQTPTHTTTPTAAASSSVSPSASGLVTSSPNKSSSSSSSSSGIIDSERVPFTVTLNNIKEQRSGGGSGTSSPTAARGGLSPVGNGSVIKQPHPDLVASCLTKDTVQQRSPPPTSLPVVPPRRKKRVFPPGFGRSHSSSEEGQHSSRNSTPVREIDADPPPPYPFTVPQPVGLPVIGNGRSGRPLLKSDNSPTGGDSSSTTSSSYPNPPSPTVSIRSVCRGLDHHALTEVNSQRICVVKAQDEEKTRAKNSGPKALRRTESLPKDVIAAFDPSGSGSGGYRDSHNKANLHPNPNSDSGSTPTAVASANQEQQQQPQDPNTKRNSLTSSEKSLKNSSGSGSNKSSRCNSAPKTGSLPLSSIVSALAAMEERKEKSGNSGSGAGSSSSVAEMMTFPQFDMIRTRTDSGKMLSDLEILEQVQRPKSLELHYHPVLNLDTGERVPLSIAEDKIPLGINPLSLHIMRLTSEYVGQRVDADRDTDEESLSSKKSSVASQEEEGASGVRKKTAQVRRFLGSTMKKTVDKAKSLTQRKHVKEDVDISTNLDILMVGGQDPVVKMKASHSHKGPYDFDRLQQVQELTGEHVGPVWCMKFSNCGRLLATAGQDKIIRIWVLKDHLPYFQDMRTKSTVDKVSPTPSQESIVSQHSHHSAEEMLQACENSDPRSPFVPRPLCTYSGHTADLLDIAWSKSFFLLSSSMDRTVRLWHISRRECLCCFQHIDFVTAIAFHPRDDRYFLSGSLDGKLRLWNIPDKKVALWNEVNGPNNLITAANFCQNGKFAVVGTYDGRCIFYHTEQLKYHTQIIVHRRKRLAGRKITGIEPMPGEDKLLVTSNDSRIRLYDLRDLSLTCKYKGFTNSSSQIKGTVSHDGKYIVSGSENQCVYIWKTNHDYSKFSSARRDRNGYWEGIKAHNAVVTSAIFAPDPDIIVKQIDKKDGQDDPDKKTPSDSSSVGKGMVKSPSLTKSYNSSSQQQQQPHGQGHGHPPQQSPGGYVLVSADFSGGIKIFFTKVKPKHSSLPASALA